MFGLVKLLALVAIAAISVVGVCVLTPQSAEQADMPRHRPMAADLAATARDTAIDIDESRHSVDELQHQRAGIPDNGAGAAGPVSSGNRNSSEVFDGTVDSAARLAEATGADALAVLRSLLDDPSPSIREEAVEALAEIGGEAVYVDLAYALSDQNKMVRLIAIEALARDASDNAVGALALTLGEEDEDLRVQVVEELATIDSVASRMLMQRFLSDENRRVRAIAAEHQDACVPGQSHSTHSSFGPRNCTASTGIRD